MGIKVKPIFFNPDLHAEEDDCSQHDEKLRLRELSYEEVVERGYRQPRQLDRITVHKYPKELGGSVYCLRRKHQHLRGIGDVQCFGTMLGVSIIEAGEILREIDHLRKSRIASGRIIDLITHIRTRHYEWGPTFEELWIPKATIATLDWVSGALTDLSAILNLSKPTVTLIALTIGLSRSERWLSEGLREPLVKERERFDRWLNQLRFDLEKC